MLAYMQTRSIPGPWPVGERLLECIGNSQNRKTRGSYRTARRLSDELKADWYANSIEDPRPQPHRQRGQEAALKGLELALFAGSKDQHYLWDSHRR